MYRSQRTAKTQKIQAAELNLYLSEPIFDNVAGYTAKNPYGMGLAFFFFFSHPHGHVEVPRPGMEADWLLLRPSELVPQFQLLIHCPVHAYCDNFKVDGIPAVAQWDEQGLESIGTQV